MIYSRPLKIVLGKIIPFNKDETINTSNLGTGTTDGTKFLKDDGSWSNVPSASVFSNYVSKTANYTLTATDTWVKCDGTFTITLPTAIGVTGKQYIISNVGTGVITVDANGSETIQGDLTQDIYQYESLTIASDGANWIAI